MRLLFERIYLLVGLALVTGVALSLWMWPQPSGLSLSSCQLDREDCTWLLEGGQVKLTLAQRPVRVEQPFRLSLYAEDESVENITTASLTGLNMAMGSIPVVFERLSHQQWRAQVLLGACSEPTMHWLLTIELKSADGRTKQLSAHFYSYWQ